MTILWRSLLGLWHKKPMRPSRQALNGMPTTRYALFLTVLAAVPIPSLAQQPQAVNAGVIAYACHDGEAKYLLAYDPHPRRRGWGAFGGGPKGAEFATETARRELRQETNCVYDADTVAGLELRGPSIVDGFHSYVAEVPFRGIREITEPRSCNDVERTFWIWVPHQSLMKALDTFSAEPRVVIRGSPNTRFHLWSEAAKSLRKARDEGDLSSTDPCKS